jgi:CNT family concentrative nucleoside transporter
MNWYENFARGIPGVIVFILIAWALSSHRKSISWRVVATGISLQFIIAILVLNVDFVAFVFSQIAAFFVQVSEFTKKC